jgi:hypothetical protein
MHSNFAKFDFENVSEVLQISQYKSYRHSTLIEGTKNEKTQN